MGENANELLIMVKSPSKSVKVINVLSAEYLCYTMILKMKRSHILVPNNCLLIFLTYSYSSKLTTLNVLFVFLIFFFNKYNNPFFFRGLIFHPSSLKNLLPHRFGDIWVTNKQTSTIFIPISSLTYTVKKKVKHYSTLFAL